MAQAIVTGGSGYVGGHLIKYLQKESSYDRIVNIDYREPALQSRDGERLSYIKADVRERIDPAPLRELGCGEDTVIYNLAAICKIPGYPAIDYFRTNIKGAEEVCRLAEVLDVKTVVFTSSVSPYGKSEELKTEESIPQPDDAYGSSKLAAEYIHRGWYEKDTDRRNLVTLRPGIIFGKNEQANFTRLYDALKKGYFFYPGRKDSRKACVYVKDVARACYYFAEQGSGYQLYNLVYPQAPTMETICSSLNAHTDAGSPWFTIPGPLLRSAAGIINGAGKLTGKSVKGIHPDRVDKVMMSTNVSGRKLAESSFRLKYSLEEGISEWYRECNGTLY